MKKILFFAIIITSWFSMLFWSCANSSVAPSGGPKDTIPPSVLAMVPLHNTVNYNGKQVSFTFNEYVQLKDQNKYFSMSPPIEKKPVLKVRGKQVIVEFPSDLQANTTYYLDFGKSVIDLNEGNPFDNNLFAIFSTGNIIDSLLYVGRVIDAFTHDPVDGMSVFLYDNNIDSLPYLKNPNAMARTDKDGVFIIKGLKSMPYKVMAVDDKNSNYKYDPGSEQIAFLDTLIRPFTLNESDSIAYSSLPKLKSFNENVRKQYLASYKMPEKRRLELIFNQDHAEIISFDVEKLTNNDFIIERSRWGDTINYWITAETLPDSIKGTLNYLKTDSLNQLTPFEIKLKFEPETTEKKEDNKNKDKDKEPEIPKLSPTISESSTKTLESNVKISFKAPLMKGDTSLIKLFRFKDAEDKQIPVNYKLIQDSIYICNYTLSAKWETATKYELQMLPVAFTDIYGVSNDTISRKFETANPDKYSSIVLDISGVKGTYIIQLLANKKDIKSQKIVRNKGKLHFAYLEPAKYRIRIIEDKNNNGIWDAGNYLNHRQPERVVFIKFAEDSEELDVRPNREMEQTVDLDQIFKEE